MNKLLKNTIVYIIFSIFSFQSFAQEVLLPTSHYKYQVVQGICEKIARVRDFERAVPELKMFARQSKTQVIAQFVAVNGHQIVYVDEKLYDLCTKFGADSLNALACIIGHELAHYTQNHQYREGFFAGLMPTSNVVSPSKNTKKSSKEHKLKLEEEADYYGLLQGYLAGFDTYRLLPNVLSKIYEEYKLNEKLEGYPTKIERIQSAEMTAKEIKTLIPVFHAGKFLYLSKNYEDAIVCFEHIANSFTDRDIANNLGVSALAQAISLMEKEEVYFAYPCEFDAAGRLLSSTTRSSFTGGNKKDKKQQIKDLLKKAQQHLDQVIKMDKTYSPAHINLACKYSLEGNHAYAIGIINDLENKLADNPMTRGGLPANAHLIRGIAFAKNNQMSQAKADFEAAEKKNAYMADYNLALYQKLNQSFIEKLLDFSSLGEWITEFIAENKKDKSKFIPAHIEKISNLTPQQLLQEKFVENATIQNQGRSVTVSATYEEDFSKIKIRLFDKNIYLIVTGQSYKGKTSQGLSIGTDKEKLLSTYGIPSYIKSGSNSEYYFYEKAKMMVEVSEGKIKNWLLYYIEIRSEN
ncbi:MAG: hypothetical protein OHK0057_18790 [Thermoflexibacter sp.]